MGRGGLKPTSIRNETALEKKGEKIETRKVFQNADKMVGVGGQGTFGQCP